MWMMTISPIEAAVIMRYDPVYRYKYVYLYFILPPWLPINHPHYSTTYCHITHLISLRLLQKVEIPTLQPLHLLQLFRSKTRIPIRNWCKHHKSHKHSQHNNSTDNPCNSLRMFFLDDGSSFWSAWCYRFTAWDYDSRGNRSVETTGE